MKKIKYATGNFVKFSYAKKMLEKYGIELEQIKVDIDEIQSDDKNKIALDKAIKIFAKVNEPLIVSDAYWEIESLNNFPGAFMKYVNDWFDADDFINLTKDKVNRNAKVTDTYVYIDEHGPKIFSEEFPGTVAKEKLDRHIDVLDTVSWDYVFQYKGKYMGEYHENFENLQSDSPIWEQFAKYIKKD